jgi:hypothetical protein
MALVRAIVAGDGAAADELLAASPELAHAHAGRGATRQDAPDHYFDEIGHYLYAGDTALHVAAAGHRHEHPRLANRGGSTPLMLATRGTGRSGSGSLEAKAQQQEIVRLLEHRTTA